MFEYLLPSATTVTSGPPVTVTDRLAERDEVAVQVSISGTAQVRIYGRLSTALPWVSLIDTTLSGIFPIARVSQMYAEIVSIVSGEVIVACHG